MTDLIERLPGYSGKLPSKTYGGYIDIGNGKNNYYIFIEAEKNASKAPIFFWTNGGPGCSGLMGLFEELGPYRPTRSGKLKYNPYTWTKFANIVFIEQPIGVGFSWSKKKNNYFSNDDISAKDNLKFILQFFIKYPQFKKNKLYLTSESYGGHYVPLWAREIIKYNYNNEDSINLKGIMIGNPYVDYLSGTSAQIESYWGNQMIRKKMWDKYTKKKCNKLENNKKWRKTWKANKCQELSYNIEDSVGKHNPYALGYPVCVSDQQNSLIAFFKKRNKTRKRMYTPCIDKFTKIYLNRNDVQKAIHAKKIKNNWKPCSDISHYTYKDTYKTSVPIINNMLNDKHLKNLHVLIMSGTADSICGTVGTQKWIEQLDIREIDIWKQYKINKEPAGYVSKYKGEGKKKFTFITVNGAGHEVPLYKPEVAYTIMKNFISNKY